MTDTIIAAMLDVTGVQDYIFASSKLVENLGASSIIKDIYKACLEPAISEELEIQDFDINSWENEDTKLFEKYSEIEIGYIGGGNALLFFKDKKVYERVIRNFCRKLLVKAPGVVVVPAFSKTSIDEIENDFGELKYKLNEAIDKNKNNYCPNINFQSYGFTESCVRTGLPAVFLSKKKNDEDKCNPLSAVSYFKTSGNISSMDDEFEKVLKGYSFIKDLDELGGEKDNFISIVHVDGNGIGNIFREQKDLESVRKLSKNLQKATNNAFEDLIKILIEKQQVKEDLLLIRPIIIGGDDITFITSKDLGIFCAEKFIENFEKRAKKETGENLTACGGITIVKTKYPFHRAYQMTEELCSNAKKKRLASNAEGSWLDFHVIENTKSGTVKNIRNKEFQNGENKLYSKPYKLSGVISDSDSFSYLKHEALKLKQMPANKRIELRSVLFESVSKQEEFINHENLRRQGTFNKDSLFENNKTIYLDALELLDFYFDKAENKGGQ